MTRIYLLFIFLFALIVGVNAQGGLTQKLVGSTANVTIVNQVPNVSYTIEFVFTSFQGYSGANIQVNDEYAVEYTLTTPKRVIRFLITAVTVVSGNRVRATLVPMSGVPIAIFPVTTGSVQRRSPFGMMASDGSAPMYLDAAIMNYNAIRSDSLFANQFSHTNGFSEIASMSTAYLGQRLKIRGFNADYLVQIDSIAGYPVDGKAVIKIPNSSNRYAVIQPGESGYDIRAFGAIADDGLADDVAIQNCINYCILNQTGIKSSTVIIPPGNWRLDRGVTVTKFSSLGAMQFVGVNIIGTGITPYSAEQGLGRQSVLEVRNKDGFGIGIQNGRNCLIKNIAFQGFSPLVYDVINSPNSAYSNSGEYSDKQYSPYAAIAVDYGWVGFDSDSYADFPEMYTAGNNSGGSSQTKIDQCVFNRFVVGIAFSLSKIKQNGDNLAITNISTQNLRTVLAIGQDQTRGGSFTNAYLLFQKEVFNGTGWGRGFGTPPIMRDLNIAGGTQTAFKFNSSNRAHFTAHNVYIESLWQLVVGAAAPATFTDCAFDFQFTQRQPDFHIVGDIAFKGCALKFYGGESTQHLWVDGFCSFTDCLIGARSVNRPGTNSGGEKTDQITLLNSQFFGRDAASRYVSSTRVLGNQLLYTNGNYAQSVGYPMETNRISSAYGSMVEVFNQPYQNIREFSGLTIKSNSTKTYIVSSSMRGVVRPGDAISTMTKWPSQNSGFSLSSANTPLGTVSSTNGDTLFMNPVSVPFNVRDTTGAYVFVQSAPSANLPVIASGTSGNNYLLVKTPQTFLGEMRPKGTGIPQGTWVTRVSAANDTLFLSTNLTASSTNGFVSFFNLKQFATSRSATDLTFNVGDKVIENGVEYICTTAGRNGSTVTPVFAATLSIGSSLIAGQVPIGNGVGSPFVGNVGFTFASSILNVPALTANGDVTLTGGRFNQSSNTGANNFAGIINNLGATQAVVGFNGTRMSLQTDLSVSNIAGSFTPDASALVHFRSTTKGSIPFPAMTTTQRDLISSPIAGLSVFNTITNTQNNYNGTSWLTVGYLENSQTWTGTNTFTAVSGVVINSTSNVSQLTLTNTTTAATDLFQNTNGDLQISTSGTRNISLILGNNRRQITFGNAKGSVISDDNTVDAGIINSAVLKLSSTTRGFLPPVLTTTQRDAISSPATGLTIYNSTTNRSNYYNGTAWVSTLATGIIGNTQIPVGTSTGDLASSSALTFTAANGMNITGTASVAYVPILNVANASGDWFTVDGNGQILLGPRYVYHTKITNGNQFNSHNYISLGGPPIKFQNLVGSNVDLVEGGGNVAIGGTNLGPKLGITGTNNLNLVGSYFAAAFEQRSTMTFSDPSSAPGTTAALAVVNEFGGGTFTATNAVTATNASTVRIAGAPIAGTNVTFTNRYALDVVTGNSIFRSGQIGINIASQYPLHVSQNGVSGAVIAAASSTANDIYFYATGTVTGSVSAIQAAINATGTINGTLQNSNTSAGGSAFRAVVQPASTGDAYTEYTVAGVQSWSTGIDNSNSDRFVINPNATPSIASTPLMVFDATNLNIGINTNTLNASSAFTVGGTTKGSIPFNIVTTVQRDAITSPATLLGVANSTTNRINLYNGTAWVEIPTVPNGGAVNTKIAVGDANGNLTFFTNVTADANGIYYGTNSGSTNFYIRTSTGSVLPGIERQLITNTPFEFFQRGDGSNRYSFRFSATDVSSRTQSTAGGISSVIQVPYGFGVPNLDNTSGYVLELNPIHNFTGNIKTGAKVVGLYYNPTLTNMTGVATHNAIETTAGNVVIGGTAHLLINNSTGISGEGDTNIGLNVRGGSGLGAEAIFNVGDQSVTQSTTGYFGGFQIFRAGGDFTTQTNLTTGLKVGQFAFRGRVNGGSAALGDMTLNYTGNGTTVLSEIQLRTAVAGSVTVGARLDDQGRFWLAGGGTGYGFPITTPSTTNLSKQVQVWTGNGTTTTSAWENVTALIVDGQYTTGTPSLAAFRTGTYQRYVATVELTSGAGANTDIVLPTADATSFGKSILISPRDLNATYDINVTGAIEYRGALSASYQLTRPTELVCKLVASGPTTYRWVVIDQGVLKSSTVATSDASGDIVVTHNANHTGYEPFVQNTLGALWLYSIMSKTATTFTVRVFSPTTGLAAPTQSVSFSWFIAE